MANFGQLIRLSSELNKKSDELNKVIENVDSYISSLNLGVEAIVSKDRKMGIAYLRVLNTNKWTICCADLNEEFKPFKECSRALRIAAIEMLPELLTVLARNAELLTKEIEQATVTLKDALIKIDEIKYDKT